MEQEMEGSECTVAVAVIFTIEGRRDHVPRCDGEIRRYFPSTNVADRSSAKKERVTSEESDSELSHLKKCVEVLDPTEER
jgi:hypothetical protein